MEEIWKDIQGYEGLYQVSNLGNVKSLKYGKERILKPSKKNPSGYLGVSLCKDNKLKTTYIHRLVAQAFIPNNDLFKTEINHKDENKGNNSVDNLEWCDTKYNHNYGTINERISKSLTKKQVNQYSKDGKTLIKTFQSVKEIKNQLGYSKEGISACCNGKLKSAYGFRWRYV